LIAVSLDEVHFSSSPKTSCTSLHNRAPFESPEAVKKTCSPGDTRELNGGVTEYGVSEAHRACISWYLLIISLAYVSQSEAVRGRGVFTH
jgi:hypothetical protein